MTFFTEYMQSKEFTNDNTLNDYSVVITRLLNQFGDNLESINKKELNDFIIGPFRYTNDESNKEYANTTYEKNIGILKSFFNQIYALELIDINYSEAIEATQQVRLMKYDELPTAEHIKAIQSYLYSQPIEENYFSMRDLVIFNLIFHSGISIDELASLTTNDAGFQGSDYCIKAINTNRLIKVSDIDAKYLTHLLTLREKLDPQDNSVFIGQKKKTGLSKRTFRYIINELCKNDIVNEKLKDKQMTLFSAEKFKKAGITAALSVGYPKSDIIKELRISEQYFNTRFKYVDHPNVTKTYADLFKE